jgi:hypothetical protein
MEARLWLLLATISGTLAIWLNTPLLMPAIIAFTVLSVVTLED